MKRLIMIFLFFFIHQASSVTVNKIEGVEGNVEVINLDSDGNIYVACYSLWLSHLYKVSASKEVLWKETLAGNVLLVEHIHITREKDVYLDILGDDISRFFAILKNNATTIQSIEAIDYDFFFTDGNDNLFYTTDEGVRIFRPNTNDSIAIENLENFYVTANGQVTIDAIGNIYTGVNNIIAVVTQESLQEETPSAQIFQISDDIKDSLNHLYFDENNDLWITLANVNNAKGTVKKFGNGALKTIVTDDSHWILNLVLAKDNVFVIAADYLEKGNTSDIYCITNENEVVEIPELKNISFDFLSTNGLADGDGNAYFFTGKKFSPVLGSIIKVTPEGMKPVPIELELADEEIVFLTLDFNEDVWIGTSSQGLYYLKKGDILAEKVEIIDNCNKDLGKVAPVFVNWLAREVYVGCRDGLYFIKT